MQCCEYCKNLHLTEDINSVKLLYYSKVIVTVFYVEGKPRLIP